MSGRQIPICFRCKKREVEMIDGEHVGLCCYCADREAERYREQQEWAYYHPADEK